LKVIREKERLLIRGFDQKGLWWTIRFGILYFVVGIFTFTLPPDPRLVINQILFCSAVTAIGVCWVIIPLVAHLVFKLEADGSRLVIRTIHKRWELINGEALTIGRYNNLLCGWLVFTRRGHKNILIPVFLEGDCDEIADAIAQHYPNCRVHFPWREGSTEDQI
jgi:hypothetical protein